MVFPGGDLFDPSSLVEIPLDKSVFINNTCDDDDDDNPFSSLESTGDNNEKEKITLNVKPLIRNSISASRRASLDSLLHQIYRVTPRRRCSSIYETESSEYSCVPDALQNARNHCKGYQKEMRLKLLTMKCKAELRLVHADLTSLLTSLSSILLKELKKRDRLHSLRHRSCDVITAILHAYSEKKSQDTRMKFTVEPFAGDSGFAQWHDAMKMCARLPGGIPQEFRRRMWLTLSEQHVRSRNIYWKDVEKVCFNEWASEDDEGLGDQIVKKLLIEGEMHERVLKSIHSGQPILAAGKRGMVVSELVFCERLILPVATHLMDLHRTGCSLFCGKDADVNQALLKRVLLGFARWNKSVGYCQGFNMLAAIILKVMDCQESDALKVMLYLIEGVLPESYFANNLRGLSVDMAVFRDLMRTHLPVLSTHLESLQQEAADKSTGACYEPPLTNVFTMQWFLTLFSNCLPEEAVMRVWDLTFLQGNEVLLRTALAIWGRLASCILQVQSADEFYTVMGNLTREMLTHGLMDGNQLVQTIVGMAPFPFPGLETLRDKYTYNITPWTQSVSTVAKKGLRIFYLEDEDDDNDKIEDHQQLAVAAAFGLAGLFKKSSDNRSGHHRQPTSPGEAIGSIRPNLDISSLKKQYEKLRERQKQAHVILTASHLKPRELCRRHSESPKSAPLAMKHLLRGKKALTSRTKRVVKEKVLPNLLTKNKVERKSSDTTGMKIRRHDELCKTMSTKSDRTHIKDSTNLKEQDVAIITVSPATSETLLWKDEPHRGRRPSLPYGVKLMQHSSTSSLPDIEDGDDGTASSTSTELCDEEDLKNLSDDLTIEHEVVRALSTSPRLENVSNSSTGKESQLSLKDFVEESKQTKVILDQKVEAILSKETDSEILGNGLPNKLPHALSVEEPPVSITSGNTSKRKLSSVSLSSPTKWKWSFSEVEDPELMQPVSPILKLHNFETESKPQEPSNVVPKESQRDSQQLSFINYDKTNMFSYLFEITDITKLSNNNSEESSPTEEKKHKYFNTEELELAVTKGDSEENAKSNSNSPTDNNQSEVPEPSEKISSDFKLSFHDNATDNAVSNETENIFRHIVINESPSEQNISIENDLCVETNNLKNTQKKPLLYPIDSENQENCNTKRNDPPVHQYSVNLLLSPQDESIKFEEGDTEAGNFPAQAASFLAYSPTEDLPPTTYDNIGSDNSTNSKRNIISVALNNTEIDNKYDVQNDMKNYQTSDSFNNCTSISKDKTVLDSFKDHKEKKPSKDNQLDNDSSTKNSDEPQEDNISSQKSNYFSDILKSLSLETNYSNLEAFLDEDRSNNEKDMEEVTPEVIRRRLWAGVKFLSLDAGALETSRMVDNILESNFPSLPTLEESPVEGYKPLPKLSEKEKVPISPGPKRPHRRKSEAALQLMKENTTLIDMFLKRRRSDEDVPLDSNKNETDLDSGKRRLSSSKSYTSFHPEDDTYHEPSEPNNSEDGNLLASNELNETFVEPPNKIAELTTTKSKVNSTKVPFSLRGSLQHSKRGQSFSHEYADPTCPSCIPQQRRTSEGSKSPSAKLQFNPFPKKPLDRPPKEVAVKLGLYAPHTRNHSNSST